MDEDLSIPTYNDDGTYKEHVTFGKGHTYNFMRIYSAMFGFDVGYITSHLCSTSGCHRVDK